MTCLFSHSRAGADSDRAWGGVMGQGWAGRPTLFCFLPWRTHASAHGGCYAMTYKCNASVPPILHVISCWWRRWENALWQCQDAKEALLHVAEGHHWTWEALLHSGSRALSIFYSACPTPCQCLKTNRRQITHWLLFSVKATFASNSACEFWDLAMSALLLKGYLKAGLELSDRKKSSWFRFSAGVPLFNTLCSSKSLKCSYFIFLVPLSLFHARVYFCKHSEMKQQAFSYFFHTSTNACPNGKPFLDHCKPPENTLVSLLVLLFPS